MVAFTGLNSVKDRTIFVKKGPISKKPLPIITGSNLQILSEVDVKIPTGTFSPAQVDFLLKIEGSPSGRNDGTFTISKVLTPNTLRLSNANFNVVDASATTERLIDLVNELKIAYEFHRNQVVNFEGVFTQVHGTNDSIHIVTAPTAVDLGTAITLLNDIKVQFEAHRIEISGDPQVHENIDDKNKVYSIDAYDINSAILLANELKRKYEDHRQEKFYHQTPDVVNKVNADKVTVVKGTYPGLLTGPFTWTLLDPQYGKAANDPADVAVRVNGNPAVVEAVIGQLGAIVLENKPLFGDDVKVDYSYIKNPPQKFLRLNSEEFHLNQAGNNAVGGFLDHLYPGSSYIIDPSSPSPDFMSPSTPKRYGWKYKAFERAYSAVLNDPTTLLLNVPSNKISFTVLEEEQSEITIYYDPVTLPNEFASKWEKRGTGVITLDAANKVLIIEDAAVATGVSENPPFYSQSLPINSPSIINSAFRARVLEDDLITDGVFTGVSFGISDGLHIANIGFIQSVAKNLSSAIFLANSLRAAFNAHFLSENVHDPDDTENFIEFADAEDLPTLVNLANVLASRFTSHISLGPLNVHQTNDVTNIITAPVASDLASSINLVNDIRVKFNAHLIQPSVHFSNDVINDVGLVKQIGILKNTGPTEFAENWESYAIDWTSFVSYRVFRDAEGNFFVYLSGDIDPIITVLSDDLPTVSDLDIDVDSIQQVYFGSVSRQATSISEWQFIRLTRTPIESVFIERNKSVEYDATTTPPLDTSNPWITIGNGGFEYITGGNLVIDSSAGANVQEVAEFGLSTGAFRGFMRLEPIQNSETTTSLEFEFATDYYTHSIDNQALGVIVDDSLFSIQFAFLQFSPTAATTTGTIVEPFTIIGGDELVMQIGDEVQKIVIFDNGDITAASAAAKINSYFGFDFASDISGKVKLTSEVLGSTATFQIISGNALAKLGLVPGKYIGTDSNPEPKVSWFEDFPNNNDPAWVVGGDQVADLLGRTLRIIDTSTTDFLTYSQTSAIVTNQAISATNDWKLSFRFNMLSFSPGDTLIGPFPYLNLDFAGLLVNVDEGTSGKNVEIHLAVNGGDTYINLVSYNVNTGNMDIMSQYAFNWNDGNTHTISLFTNKSINQIRVYGDGQVLAPYVGPSPTYTGLRSGYAGPSITFGSGATGASNVDLATSQSVCDWEAVNIFRDSKISDPTAASKRYIGLYTGGPTNQLSSYITHQVDWTLFHTYRIIRDPVTAVSVYIDNGNVPVITTSYDNLSLPLINSSYLTKATGGRSNISFGAFNPIEISRSRWGYVKYSIGKLTRSELIIPPHNLLNQHNVIASGEHLKTKLPHNHLGTTVYSGGTPQDDFMANPDLIAATMLNEGTPPVPMTQDLESRGGLVKTATLVDAVSTVDFVNFKGDLSNFNNDEFNIIGDFSIADLANNLKSKYNSHISSKVFHDVKDTINVVVLPDATSIVTSIALLNDIKAKYNAHLTQVGIHVVNDGVNGVITPDAVDLDTAITLANSITDKFSDHIVSTVYHLTFDTVNTVSAPQILSSLDSAINLANDIKAKYLAHTFQYNVHLANDTKNVALSSDATDLSTAISLANSIKEQYNLHRVAVIRETQKVHITHDTVNIITYPDAVDIDTLTDLLLEIKIKYTAHLTQTDVHAATVFIIMDVPNRVLYDNIQFWKTEEGEGACISPFCDMVMFPEGGNGFTNFDVPGFYFPGTELPEEFTLEQTIRLANDLKEQINLHFVAPGVHVSNDVFNTIVSPDATNLAMVIVLLNEIKAAFNAHLIQSGVHTANDPTESVITVNASNLGTAQALANQLRIKYEIHRMDAVLHLIADNINVVTELPTTNPGNPGWQLLTDGGTPNVQSLGNSISMATPELMQAMYRYDGVIPTSPNINFEFAVSMKINSYAPPTGPDYDTRIYAGFTSEMNPGVAAAIGFEFVNGKPMVKIHDVNSDTPLARVHDPWPGQSYRTFRIVRDVKTDTFQLFFEPGDGIFDDTFDDTFN